MDKKLMLIDGNSILNRAYYGIGGKTLLSTSDGLYTNAVYGFLNILNKFLEEENPDYLCVAFDLKAPTFRHKEYEGYKANRKGMPEELAVQVPVMKDVLDAMNIKRVEIEGYEADDIIGSLSLFGENNNLQVVVVTGDRDALQLASRTTRIKIPTTKAGKTITNEYDYDAVLEKFGVEPVKLIDVKALMGDTSDNIPGVPGIGEKTALELIKNFGYLEELYENIDKVEKKSVKAKLEEYKDQAFLCKRLAAINRNIDYPFDIEEFKRREPDREKLYELFKRLEFNSLIAKFGLDEMPAKRNAISKTVRFIEREEDLHELVKTLYSQESISIYHLIDKIGTFESRLTGIAFSWGEDKSVYVPLNRNITEDGFFALFRELFEDEKVKKCGHDIKSFIVYLKNKGMELNGLAFDTMVGAYLINPSKETYTVAELASEYLNVDIRPIEELSGKGKNFVPYFKMDINDISSVAGLHAEILLSLWKALNILIENNGQHELYYNIELPLVEVLADMEYQGFKVNINELKDYSRELEEKIDKVTESIYQMAGEEFNINSTKQLGVILFEKLKLPVIKKTKTGYSTDAEVLEELSGKHEIIESILEYRQLVKLKSTYVEGLINVINPYTNKIHSNFNQTVTSTGRISSTEPNLQNIPVKLEIGRKIRKVFVPRDENYILMDADYSQIELRVLAHITGDENMISAFRNNLDIHTKTASEVFGVPQDEVTPAMRASAKAVNFGIVYGIGDFSLAKDLGITRKQARNYIDQYLNKYPKVKEYMHNIVEKAKEQGFVTTLFNRRRYLPELKSKNFTVRSFGERIAMNTPIQGSAADIIKIAMVKVYKRLKSENLKSRLILQVHDELLIETLISEKEQVAKILKESMENAADLLVPLSVEVKYGKNWYEAK